MDTISFLDILRERRLNVIPPHFAKIKIENLIYEKHIIDWIERRLTGRFSVSNELSVEENKIVPSRFIGFEDPKELTFFILSYNQGDHYDR